jgi:hypothetical protein
MFASIIIQDCDMLFLVYIFTSQFFYDFYVPMQRFAFKEFYQLFAW